MREQDKSWDTPSRFKSLPLSHHWQIIKVVFFKHSIIQSVVTLNVRVCMCTLEGTLYTNWAKFMSYKGKAVSFDMCESWPTQRYDRQKGSEGASDFDRVYRNSVQVGLLPPPPPGGECTHKLVRSMRSHFFVFTV